MNRTSTARWILTGAALFIAIGPPLADFNETHILNPLWSGHARLHTAWLVTTNALVALFALVLLWRNPARIDRVALQSAAALVGCVLVGFFVAAAAQSLYGGSLTDPNGIPFRVGSIDANLAGFGLLALGVVLAVILARSDPA